MSVDPRIDNIRSDPRFEDFLRRVGVAKQVRRADPDMPILHQAKAEYAKLR